MSYRFKSGQALADGLKRVFHEEIESARKETRRSSRKPGEAVHEFRKHLKKLRAALRLVADEVGQDRHEQVDRCIRDIAKVVSGLRDAHVRWQTVVQLRGKFPKRRFGRVFRRVEDLLSMELTSFIAAYADWKKQVVPKLTTVEKQIEGWPFKDLTWKRVCGAVAKTYRRGQKKLAKAQDDPQPERFHAWRKEVKDLLYQLRLLSPLNRVVLEEPERDARTLGELLGQQHDLAFLLSRLKMERKNETLREPRTKLDELIRKRTKRLQRDATELGRRFYAEPAKAFAKRISIFTREWAA
jgi:CHAD domain-containing protein